MKLQATIRLLQATKAQLQANAVLQAELQATKAEQQATIRLLMTTKAELQANADLQATKAELLHQNTNAELQATIRLLQATKTELQATTWKVQDTEVELQATKAELQNTKVELQESDGLLFFQIRGLGYSIVEASSQIDTSSVFFLQQVFVSRQATKGAELVWANGSSTVFAAGDQAIKILILRACRGHWRACMC